MMLSDMSRDILVIDEDPITYQILQNCFFSKDVAVHWAKTAQQALAITTEKLKVIHLEIALFCNFAGPQS